MSESKASLINAASLDEIDYLFKQADPHTGIFLEVDDALPRNH
jgi:hypothetical protein